MQSHFVDRLFVRLAGGVFTLAVLICFAPRVCAQNEEKLVAYLVKQQLRPEGVVADQLRHFLLGHVPPLQLPRDTAQWDAEAAKLRARELAVVYHGWPRAWVDAPPKFEEVGTLEGRGYHIRKLRYEVVPGMY